MIRAMPFAASRLVKRFLRGNPCFMTNTKLVQHIASAFYRGCRANKISYFKHLTASSYSQESEQKAERRSVTWTDRVLSNASAPRFSQYPGAAMRTPGSAEVVEGHGMGVPS